MKTITRVFLIGEVDEDGVDRRTVDTKTGKAKVAEFKLEGCGMKITAFGDERAEAVTDEGVLIIEGYIATRQYEYPRDSGEWRTAVEIKATSIQSFDGETLTEAQAPAPAPAEPKPASQPKSEYDKGGDLDQLGF